MPLPAPLLATSSRSFYPKAACRLSRWNLVTVYLALFFVAWAADAQGVPVKIWVMTQGTTTTATDSGDQVYSVMSDGSGWAPLTITGTALVNPVRIAVDADNGYAYVADGPATSGANSSVLKINLSTGASTALNSQLNSSYGTIRDVRIDFSSGLIYALYQDSATGTAGSNDKIIRMDSSGGNVTTIATAVSNSPLFMAIDGNAGVAYMADNATGATGKRIFMIRLDPSSPSSSIFYNGSAANPVPQLSTVAVDYINSILYHLQGDTDLNNANAADGLYKVSLAATPPVTTFTAVTTAGLLKNPSRSLALDFVNGLAYVGDFTQKALFSINLTTGTQAAISISSLSGLTSTAPFDIAIANVPVAPTVTTPESSSIATTTATLGGKVTNNGNGIITERGIVYSATSANANPIIDGTGVIKVTTTGGNGTFTIPVSSLTGSTGYSFKAYVKNSAGTSYTSVATFTTQAPTANAPTVTTPTSSGITDTAATLGGNVTSDGGATITERGVVYAVTSTNSNPQLSGTGVTKATTTGTTGVFTVNVSSLAPGTTYSFAAYATNSTGTTYAAPVSTFTTQASVLSLNLASATPTNAATVNWTLTFDSAVSGVATSNFSLSGTGTSGASVGTPTTSNGGLTWNVPVTTGGSGTLTLSLANATGLTPSIATTLLFAGQTCTVDKITNTPTLTTPATGGASSNPISVSYSLPEAALNGSVKLTFAGSSTVTLTLAAADGTPGAHSFSFDPGNVLGSAHVASATAPTIADGSYTVTLAYQDVLGNATASTSATSFTVDTTTQTPTLSAPATNGVSSSPFAVSFSLPEAALNGSVQLTFTGGSTITLTLASNQQTAGAHSFTVDAANVLSSSNIASSTAGIIPNGTYTVALSYQDALGNSAASSNPATNFTLASAPTVTTPTSASITGTAATLGGNVTSNGGAAITERGVVYSVTTTNGSPQLNGSGVTKVMASGTTGVFTAGVSGLTAATEYSYAAYATNSIGTSYSSVGTFTTLSNNADLSNLVLSAGTLTPVFAAGTTSYTATVLKASATITVTPTVEESHATLQVRVNGGSYASVTSGSASGSLVLNLGANPIDVLVTAQDGTTTKTYTTTVTRWTNFQNWRNQYFSTIANSGNAADTATPQNDGLPNLLKFAMGLDPTKNVLVADSIAKSGNNLQFNYQRNIEAIGEVTFIVEWSDTLQSNDWHTGGMTEAILSATSTLQQVQATMDVTGAPRRFMRLRVTNP